MDPSTGIAPLGRAEDEDAHKQSLRPMLDKCRVPLALREHPRLQHAPRWRNAVP